VILVAAADATAALAPGSVPSSTTPEPAGRVTDATVAPPAVRIGAGSRTVCAGDPGGLTSAVPAVKSRRSRLPQVWRASVASPRFASRPPHQPAGVWPLALTASLPVEIRK
jgi:hypothetical protein